MHIHLCIRFQRTQLILKRFTGKLFFDCKKSKPCVIAPGFKEVKLRKLSMMWSAVFLLCFGTFFLLFVLICTLLIQQSSVGLYFCCLFCVFQSSQITTYSIWRYSKYFSNFRPRHSIGVQFKHLLVVFFSDIHIPLTFGRISGYSVREFTAVYIIKNHICILCNNSLFYQNTNSGVVKNKIIMRYDLMPSMRFLDH